MHRERSSEAAPFVDELLDGQIGPEIAPRADLEQSRDGFIDGHLGRPIGRDQLGHRSPVTGDGDSFTTLDPIEQLRQVCLGMICADFACRHRASTE